MIELITLNCPFSLFINSLYTELVEYLVSEKWNIGKLQNLLLSDVGERWH